MGINHNQEIISGLRDNEVVAFSDYSADMKESSDRAVAVIQAMRREIDNLERMLWLVLDAVGGRVEVSHNAIQSYDKRRVGFARWENHGTMGVVIEREVIIS